MESALVVQHGGAMNGRDPNRVIVADDDEAMRMLLAAALETEGFEVVEASSGHELVRTLDGVPRDGAHGDGVALVLVDFRMPGMNGLEAVRTLRAAHWEMPIIMMTAFADPELQAEAVGLGIPVLSKPFRLDVLTNLVELLLSRTRMKSS